MEIFMVLTSHVTSSIDYVSFHVIETIVITIAATFILNAVSKVVNFILIYLITQGSAGLRTQVPNLLKYTSNAHAHIKL